MSDKPLAPAIAGWHTMAEEPHLIGSQCSHCSTYFFPPAVPVLPQSRLRQHGFSRGAR